MKNRATPTVAAMGVALTDPRHASCRERLTGIIPSARPGFQSLEAHMPRTKKTQRIPAEHIPDLRSAVDEALGRLAVAKNLLLEYGHDLRLDEEMQGWDKAIVQETICGVRELLMKAAAKEDEARHSAQAGGAR